jgi:zinc/manganese transport system permease protein
LVVECFDPGFLRSVGGSGGLYHMLFLVIVVSNLVAAFQALGTLMAVGLMMLPAAASRFWAHDVWRLCLVSVGFAFLSGYAGLVVSFQYNLPSGPAIVLLAGGIYVFSFLFGPKDGLIQMLIPRRHLEA